LSVSAWSGQLFTQYDLALSRKHTLLSVWRRKGLDRLLVQRTARAHAGTIAMVSRPTEGDFASFDFIIGEKGVTVLEPDLKLVDQPRCV